MLVLPTKVAAAEALEEATIFGLRREYGGVETGLNASDKQSFEDGNDGHGTTGVADLTEAAHLDDTRLAEVVEEGSATGGENARASDRLATRDQTAYRIEARWAWDKCIEGAEIEFVGEPAVGVVGLRMRLVVDVAEDFVAEAVDGFELIWSARKLGFSADPRREGSAPPRVRIKSQLQSIECGWLMVCGGCRMAQFKISFRQHRALKRFRRGHDCTNFFTPSCYEHFTHNWEGRDRGHT